MYVNCSLLCRTDRNKAIGFQNMNIDKQGSSNVFESGRQFGHVEERLVAKLSLVSSSEIPEVNKSLISLLRPFSRLSYLTLN